MSATHNNDSAEWKRIRLAVLSRDESTCAYCGGEATHVDHIMAKANGGSDSMDNLVASCAPCNLRKGAKVLVRRPYWDTAYLDHI